MLIQKFCALPRMRQLDHGLLMSASRLVGSEVVSINDPPGEVMISMRPVSVFANGLDSGIEQLRVSCAASYVGDAGSDGAVPARSASRAERGAAGLPRHGAVLDQSVQPRRANYFDLKN